MLPSLIRLVSSILVSTLTLTYVLTNQNIDNSSNIRFTKGHQQLINHSKIFDQPEILNVTEGVYVAVGYALSNMILINGTDGLIIIDTTENSKIALNILRDYRQAYGDIPLRGIILTHFHNDHIAGAYKLVEDEKQNKGIQVKVFAHSSMKTEIQNFQQFKEGGLRRVKRQFGVILDEDQVINSGIGYKLLMNDPIDCFFPNITTMYDHKMNITLAGLQLQLIHTPGETKDQTTVWFPGQRVVFPADNIYSAFPNIYAIRGSAPRDAKTWYKSLDTVRRLKAHFMVPSHTRPLAGRDVIFDTITCYRDAIQFVHDQTVRLINKGMSLDDIVASVKLPTALASHGYLQEYYGTVEWSVRGVYEFYMGWYDGEVENLFPLSKTQEAKMMERLLLDRSSWRTPVEQLLNHAHRSLDSISNNLLDVHQMKIELRWVLKLSSMIFKLSPKGSESYEDALQIRITCLNLLSSLTINAIERNYYLTSAAELQGKDLIYLRNDNRRYFIDHISMDRLIQFLPINVNSEKCSDDDDQISVLLKFDEDQKDHKEYQIMLRNCVFNLGGYGDEHAFDEPDIVISMKSTTWRAMLKQRKTSWLFFNFWKINLEGSVFSAYQFVRYLS